MDRESKNYSRGARGLSFFFVVLTLGLLLAAFEVGIGGGATIKIPFTEVNISIGGTLTIWLAEGIGVIVLGNQPEAPVADLSINLLR